MGVCYSSYVEEVDVPPSSRVEQPKPTSDSPATKQSRVFVTKKTKRPTKPDSNSTAGSSNHKTSKPHITRNTQGRLAKSAASQRRIHHSTNAGTGSQKADEEPFANADPKKWVCVEQTFSGSAIYEEIGRQEEVTGKSTQAGIKLFQAHPKKYTAITYQTSMLDWPEAQQKYTLIHRAGTKGYKVQGASPKGWMTILQYEYQRLPPLKDNQLPKPYRDQYTDTVLRTFRRQALPPPIMPGRGMGLGDTAHLKVIGDVDPSDISQGSVGNCWLLSGISALAEFDGAVKRLFRKTKQLPQMPKDPRGNLYTISLWDLSTWKEVDVVVDERLCVSRDGQLLGSKLSTDGELWVCYLEKALAAHCGGWDKLVGGQCTHAWALLTGCKEQYTIRRNEKTGKFACYARYNPYSHKWAKHSNSPHDCDARTWRVAWPRVGGGGSETLELDEEEVFMRLCAWDDENYIVGASTDGVSDKHSREGMVDNHAYSVLESINDVAGTDIDLIKVRNPWGRGEIENGLFDDDGPGWDQYPQIKRALNPVVADDGIFWVTKQEFFKFYGTIYLSASNMTEFLED